MAFILEKGGADGLLFSAAGMARRDGNLGKGGEFAKPKAPAVGHLSQYSMVEFYGRLSNIVVETYAPQVEVVSLLLVYCLSTKHIPIAGKIHWEKTARC